jgi:hypothetical protein
MDVNGWIFWSTLIVIVVIVIVLIHYGFKSHRVFEVKYGRVPEKGNTKRKQSSPLPSSDPFEELLRSTPQTDSSQASTVRATHPGTDISSEDQAVYQLELTVQLGYAVARADGRLAQAERAAIEEHFERQFARHPAMENRARSLCAHYAKASIDLKDLVSRIKRAFPASALPSLLDFARTIARAGSTNARKTACYEELSRGLSFTSSEPKSIPMATLATSGPAFHTSLRGALEIDPDVSLTAELVRRQYNKLAERYNAAKLAHLGADFEKLAAERHAAARAAAEAFLQELSEPLELPTPPPPASLRENRELDELFGG